MNKFFLTEETCEAMAQTAKIKSRELGIGVTLSISDENGNLRYLQRFGNAILPSLEISPKKAYTAAVLRLSTSEFGQIAQVGGNAFGINIADPRLVIFGGGFPLQIDGVTVGGIGISGGSVEEDEKIAKEILKTFCDLMA